MKLKDMTIERSTESYRGVLKDIERGCEERERLYCLGK